MESGRLDEKRFDMYVGCKTMMSSAKKPHDNDNMHDGEVDVPQLI